MIKIPTINVLVGIGAIGFVVYSWYHYRKKFFRAKKNQKIQIQINNNAVGHVICKCRSTIKAVESKSGAKIKFIPSEISSDFTVCIVKGDEVSVKQTIALINDAVKNCCKERGGNSVKFQNELKDCEDTFFPDQMLFNISDITDQIPDSTFTCDSKEFNETENFDEARNIPDFVTQHTQKLRSQEDNGFVPVYVSAVATPGQFWIQAVKTKEHVELGRLTEELSEYFQSHPQLNIPPPTKDIKPGYLCVLFLSEDERWYRVEVSEVTPHIDNICESIVDLFLLDYGESIYQKISNIRAIPSKFLILKFQAIECGLMHVKPSKEHIIYLFCLMNNAWSAESILFFEKVTHVSEWYTLMARVDSWEDDHPRLTLVDSNSDVNIGDEIVKNGFAEYDF